MKERPRLSPFHVYLSWLPCQSPRCKTKSPDADGIGMDYCTSCQVTALLPMNHHFFHEYSPPRVMAVLMKTLLQKTIGQDIWFVFQLSAGQRKKG